MTIVSFVRLGSTVPMGQQAYESQLLAALRRPSFDRWTVEDRAIHSLRSGRGVRGRLPLRVVWAAPYTFAATVGALVYGRADLVHRLDLRCPPSGRREVLTIHDLCPLRFDDEGTLPRWAARSARAASAVICPSEFAAQEVRDALGVKQTYVVPNGVDANRGAARPLSQVELAELGLHEPLVVHVGGATARKNLRLLAAAWPEVLAEHPDASLALCGPPDRRRQELFNGLRNTRYLGYRTTPFVARLIRSATAVAVPSKYEGFGLPALEAMVAGVPVVAAACGALPEVCGDAARLVEPTPAAFAAAIGEVIAGGDAIERLRASGFARVAAFSWERCARETVAVYEGVLG